MESSNRVWDSIISTSDENSPQDLAKHRPVSIVGTGTEYPPYKFNTETLAGIAHNHFSPSPALEKTLSLSQNSAIEQRYTVLDPDKFAQRRKCIPSIADCDRLFKEYGVPLAAKAANNAISCWGGLPAGLTHIIAVTCTNTSNPGLDVALCKELRLPNSIHRTLLHGVGCAGGLSGLRTAYELLLGSSFRGRPGRALVVACEITSIFMWAELEYLHCNQKVSPGIGLFGDCASALVLSNGIHMERGERPPIWDVLNVKTELLEGSEGCLEYNIFPTGYIGTISKSVPGHIRRTLKGTFEDLLKETSQIASEKTGLDPKGYDWALHPGGYKIIQTAQEVLGLDKHHLRKSYEIYCSKGNTSSTTVLSVLDSLRLELDSRDEGREKVIAAAFGPGMTIEMALLRRGNQQ